MSPCLQAAAPAVLLAAVNAPLGAFAKATPVTPTAASEDHAVPATGM